MTRAAAEANDLATSTNGPKSAGRNRFLARLEPFAGSRTARVQEDLQTSQAAPVIGYTRSKTAAMPCPPPMHMVARAYRPPVRLSS